MKDNGPEFVELPSQILVMLYVNPSRRLEDLIPDPGSEESEEKWLQTEAIRGDAEQALADAFEELFFDFWSSLDSPFLDFVGEMEFDHSGKEIELKFSDEFEPDEPMVFDIDRFYLEAEKLLDSLPEIVARLRAEPLPQAPDSAVGAAAGDGR